MLGLPPSFTFDELINDRFQMKNLKNSEKMTEENIFFKKENVPHTWHAYKLFIGTWHHVTTRRLSSICPMSTPTH